MAFEAFPSDAVDAFHDPGIYYVHEKGKLRSPPGMGPSSRDASSSFDLASGSLQIPPICFEDVTSAGHKRVAPRSLFSQTITFVAAHMQMVESLVGFPEIVGKQLFDAAMELGVFTRRHLRLPSLQLFVEAYGYEMLSSLNVQGNHTMLADYLPEVMLFTHLSGLELGGCCLGENHEIWTHIGRLPCLERLGLRKTGMSDRVMQKITTPLRLLDVGPRVLRVLDLSENPKVTHNSLRYLKIFTQLEALDLTGCAFSSQGIQHLQLQMGLRQLGPEELVKMDMFSRPVENVGWGSGLVLEWLDISKTAAAMENQQPLASCPKAKKFYSNSSKQLGFLDISVKPVATSTNSPLPPMVFLKDLHCKKKNPSTSSSKESLTPLRMSEMYPNSRASENDCRLNTGKTLKDLNDVEHETDQRRSLIDEYSTNRRTHNDTNGNQEQKSDLPETKVKYVSKVKKRIKVVANRKRKRGHSENERNAASKDVLVEEEEDDLLNCYLKVKTDDDDLGKGSSKSKLLNAMDSTGW